MPKSADSLRKLVARLKDASADHQERHRPSGFSFALSDSIEFLNASHWDKLTADASIFMQRPYLAALEQTAPANLQPRYAIISRGATPVAAMAGQIVRITGSQLTAPADEPSVTGPGWVKAALKRTAGKLRRDALSTVKLQIFGCGSFLSWGHDGVAIAPGEDHAAVWTGVTEAIYRIRRAEKLAGETDFAIVRDIAANNAAALRVLPRYSYRHYESEPDMVLEFADGWCTYADYLGGLNKKYRKVAKGFDTALAQAGCTVETLTDLAPHAARLHQLYLQVHEKNALRLVMLRPEYLPALARALGNDFRCTVVRRGGEIVGFVTTIRDRNTAVGYYIGYDQAANEAAPIYLRLLCAVIADGLALGCRRVTFGRTALEPKARLGAKPVPYKMLIRHRNPVINALIPNLLQGLIPNQQPPERHPLKAVDE